MIIREFSPEDRPALDVMMYNLEQDLAGADLAGEKIEFDSIAMAHAYLDGIFCDVQDFAGRVFIAEQDGQPVGFIQGVIIDKNDLQHQKRKDGWVGLLFVSEDYRNHGVGHSLLSKMQDYFRASNCDTVRLLTSATNEYTLGFYRRAGFSAREVEMAIDLRRNHSTLK